MGRCALFKFSNKSAVRHGSHIKRPSSQAGFTLVETLIALLIVGVTTGALLTLIGQNTRFNADAQDRFIASMVGDTIMVEALANPAILDRGIEEFSQSLGGRDWIALREIGETSLPGIITVTVSVRREGQTQIRSTISTLKSEGQS